ncbi:hypothetical protein [Streptomyces sp. NPDC002845]
MTLVPRLLEWVRTLLFGPPVSGRPASSAAPETGRSLSVRCPSPQYWGIVLGQARRRRAPHLWPPAVEDNPVVGLVRLYVPPPEECTHPMSISAGEAR